jgi:beta-N-acetylhexosaminidase
MQLGRTLRIAAACFALATALAAAGADARTTAGPTTGQLVGQLVFVRMPGTTPTASFLARISRGEIGGVVLYGDNYGSAGPAELVNELRQAAASGGQPRLLIGIDQEGGDVRRLPGPPTRSPQQMTTTSVARAQGRATAYSLRGYGIDVDFAPVLDIGRGGFITSRTFGSTPSDVAFRGTAFAHGLALGGVIASGKHFPGLGYAATNTDRAQTIVHATAPQLEADLLPYRKAIAAGLPMVMVSTAIYPSLGVNVPAACAKRIVTGLLRQELGFHGVVVTDALATPNVNAYWPTTTAAVKAIGAGVDMVIAGGGTGRTANKTSEAVYRALVAAVNSGALSRTQVAGSYARVLALKRTLS